MVTRGRVLGEGQLEKGGRKVQTSSYKINKCQGDNVQHIVNTAIQESKS